MFEDDLVRGVHPMVGRRLNLWRLRNFDVTRVEAPEDVLLYECVAKENPQDRRLVALAQVRQLAVVRDDDGQRHRPAPRRAGRGELPRGDPAHPQLARRGRQQARQQPRLGAGVAAGRGRPRPAERAAGQDHAADRRHRHRRGAGAGPRGDARRPGAAGDPLPRPARRRRDGVVRGAADRAAGAAGRVRLQGRARASSRAGLPLRARGRAGRARRVAGRARPRRHRRARAGRPAARAQQGRHPGRRRDDADRRFTRKV